MPLIRGEHFFEGKFTQVPNEWVRDEHLSLKARGLLVLLMSHSPGWSVSVESIAGSGPDGRDAIKTAVKELEARGYLTREQVNENGRFGEANWITSDPGPWVEKPLAEKPLAENPTPKNTNNKNTIEKKPGNRATQMTEDWAPDQRLMDMFQSKWTKIPAKDIQHHIEQFKLYWMGTGRPMKNWDMTFQKWMGTVNHSQGARVRQEPEAPKRRKF